MRFLVTKFFLKILKMKELQGKQQQLQLVVTTNGHQINGLKKTCNCGLKGNFFNYILIVNRYSVSILFHITVFTHIF